MLCFYPLNTLRLVVHLLLVSLLFLISLDQYCERMDEEEEAIPGSSRKPTTRLPFAMKKPDMNDVQRMMEAGLCIEFLDQRTGQNVFDRGWSDVRMNEAVKALFPNAFGYLDRKYPGPGEDFPSFGLPEQQWISLYYEQRRIHQFVKVGAINGSDIAKVIDVRGKVRTLYLGKSDSPSCLHSFPPNFHLPIHQPPKRPSLTTYGKKVTGTMRVVYLKRMTTAILSPQDTMTPLLPSPPPHPSVGCEDYPRGKARLQSFEISHLPI